MLCLFLWMRVAREGAFYHSIVSTANEIKLIFLEEFGEPKRARSSGQFSCASYGGICSHRGSGSFQCHRLAQLLCQQLKLGCQPEVFMVLAEVSMDMGCYIRTHFGHYEFLGMSFHSTNSPTMFMELTNEGLQVDPAKIEAVRAWTRCTLVTEIKIFVSVSFQWSDECEESFQKFKTFFTLTPVLTLLEEGVDFIVYCNASGVGLGGVLLQKGKISKVTSGLIAFTEDRSSIVEKIHEHLFDYEKLCLIRDKVMEGKPKWLSLILMVSWKLEARFVCPSGSSLQTSLRQGHPRTTPTKYVSDESHGLSLDSVESGPDLSFEEEPIAIFDRQVRKLRTKDITSMKVKLMHHSVGEATWETESDKRSRYPQLFETSESYDAEFFAGECYYAEIFVATDLILTRWEIVPASDIVLMGKCSIERFVIVN
ncbi:hypothetical protein MTR67_003372 [Solanum verrucosum]|uniref:Reverse transcriptase/retrotransposon-derived protein RNase H-like domain-containing protein n=1 Tax=Solanum verrucosum TaxID=315347 RepID=A0AAF0PSD1_SOLVR|nr:hypothetical protein MTR67_003372 [Solanum verrucosum]